MSTTVIRLWFIRQTEKARLYCKFPPEQLETDEMTPDLIWIPLSIIEHTTKRGNEHVLTLPDWWVEKSGL